jgi:hypothetical protein
MITPENVVGIGAPAPAQTQTSSPVLAIGQTPATLLRNVELLKPVGSSAEVWKYFGKCPYLIKE